MNVQNELNNQMPTQRVVQKRQRQRSRSRQKQYKNKNFTDGSDNNQIKLQAGEMHYDQYLQKEEQFHQNQQVLRSFLRIEQGRQQPIDKFVKILYIYKGKYEFDPKLKDLMLQPKKYLNKLSLQQLSNMVTPAKRHILSLQKFENRRFYQYWKNLIKLIEYKIQKKQQKLKQQINQQDSIKNFEIKQKIKTMLNKNQQQLQKLLRKIQMMIKNSNFQTDMSYWQKVKRKTEGKLLEISLKKYYQHYKKQNAQQIQKLNQNELENQNIEEQISPILQPITSFHFKNAITPQFQLQQRKKLSEDIFRQQFQKHKQKLQNNLSLPKNHNLLSKDFVTQSTKTYDLITQQIMEFQKYKRMEDDEEEFDDWVPIQTEGRFRDRKPEYINRVRISHDHNRYGQSGIIRQRTDDKQPPPKQIQGYKFNVFYPDLFDKQKTPQYFLQALEDPNYMLIKFKAGPPYKDIAFKILRKEWDFTQKSGFQAIFTKGILQLYFNFKKPKYRI